MTFTILALIVLMVLVIVILNGNYSGYPYKLTYKNIVVTVIPKSEYVTNFILTLLRRKRRRLRIRRGTVF